MYAPEAVLALWLSLAAAGCAGRRPPENRPTAQIQAGSPDIRQLVDPDDVLVGGDLIQAIDAVRTFRASTAHVALKEHELDIRLCVFIVNRYPKSRGAGEIGVAVVPKSLPVTERDPYVRGFVYVLRRSDLAVLRHYEME